MESNLLLIIFRWIFCNFVGWIYNKFVMLDEIID
jgi:hypothetical protein